MEIFVSVVPELLLLTSQKLESSLAFTLSWANLSNLWPSSTRWDLTIGEEGVGLILMQFFT